MIDGLPERIYDTGDYGRLNQNLNIEFLGREDDQVKVNGFRIELGEISGHLNSLDEVQQSYVTTTKSPSGETKLVAFILIKEQAADIEKLRAALSVALPNYMIPQLIPRTSPFPLTATNKIDKNALLSTLPGDRNSLKKSAAKIQAFLAEQGMDVKVIELAATTRSAMDAAQALDCDVTHIVKSLVFQTRGGKKPVVVLASGPNRVDLQRIAEIVGEPIERAKPDFVRETTGFAIGGVPPIGHKVPSQVIVDQDLVDLVGVWAAAGTPNAVFQVSRPITDILNDYRVAAIKEAANA
jgi:prolyl-tRNA editing enzyme YbaK/EbsC (Cys-tRNA(Pro) deacylase)